MRGTLILGISLLSGCATAQLQTMTSGHVPCAPPDIAVYDWDSHSMTGGDGTWKAVCKGKLAYCHVGPDGTACSVSDDPPPSPAELAAMTKKQERKPYQSKTAF